MKIEIKPRELVELVLGSEGESMFSWSEEGCREMISRELLDRFEITVHPDDIEDELEELHFVDVVDCKFGMKTMALYRL